MPAALHRAGTVAVDTDRFSFDLAQAADGTEIAWTHDILIAADREMSDSDPAHASENATRAFSISNFEDTLMRYSTLSFVVAGALATNLAQAQVAPTTITFHGEVNDQTCEVLINGEKNSDVTLHSVNTNELPGAHSVARITPFTLALTKCDDKKSKVVAVIFSKSKITETGDLDNVATENPAKGVAIRLFEDGTGQKMIDFSKNSRARIDINPNQENDPIHTFSAAYVRVGDEAVTAGKVKAVAEYSISYL